MGSSYSWTDTDADISCVGYDELFLAANGRMATVSEEASFDAASQGEKNLLVRGWVARTGGNYVGRDVEGSDGRTYTSFFRSEKFQDTVRWVGGLPPTLQGVALELQIGEEASVDNTGKVHYSRGHGLHGDCYLVRRITADQVTVLKEHVEKPRGLLRKIFG